MIEFECPSCKARVKLTYEPEYPPLCENSRCDFWQDSKNPMKELEA